MRRPTPLMFLNCKRHNTLRYRFECISRRYTLMRGSIFSISIQCDRKFGLKCLPISVHCSSTSIKGETERKRQKFNNHQRPFINIDLDSSRNADIRLCRPHGRFFLKLFEYASHVYRPHFNERKKIHSNPLSRPICED